MHKVWVAGCLLALGAGNAGAAEVRLGLNTSATLGCEVIGARAGIQEGRFGGFVQGSYCSSNVTGQSGSGVFGAGLTVDLYQSATTGLYALLGGNTAYGGSIYGGLGARYGVPLLPVEAYIEGGVSRANTVVGPLTSPKFALGVSYIMRGIDLKAAAGNGQSSPSNIAAYGTSGLNVDKNGTAGASAPTTPVPSSCNLTPESDAAAARAAANAAAQSALSAAASAYSAVYSNVSYEVSVGEANVSGNSATVTGTLTLKATQRSTGEPVSGTYSGVVTLVRSGCGWVATGYRQNGG